MSLVAPPVALDTSALMMPVELDVRLFDELDRLLGDYEPVVPAVVLEELEGLSRGDGEAGTAASVGADLAVEHCRTVQTDASGADDAIVELAADGRVRHVVTNDRPLGDRVRDEGVSVIALRGRNKLAITRP